MMQRQHLTKTTEEQFIEVDRRAELRCHHCNRLLALGNIGDRGKIELKCTRCKELCRFERL